jgi:hypothetical protein
MRRVGNDFDEAVALQRVDEHLDVLPGDGPGSRECRDRLGTARRQTPQYATSGRRVPALALNARGRSCELVEEGDGFINQR